MLRLVWLLMLGVGSLLVSVSIVLMILFRVFSLIGELSGKTAERQIERLKQLNVNTTTTSNLMIDVDAGVKEDIPIKEFNLLNIQETNKEGGKVQEIIEVATSEDKTSYMEEENKTTFMEDNDKTSFIDDIQDCSPTTFMEDSVNNDNIHVVILLKEQTSLKLD